MKFSIKMSLLALELVLIFGYVTAFDYCTLNDNVCEGVTHIACGTMESKLMKHIPEKIQSQVNVTTEKLTVDEQLALINAVNRERNKIALGQTQLPKASNLQKTVWDDELELLAKSLAEVQSIGDDGVFCYKRQNGKTVYQNILRHKENPRTSQDAVRDILENTENNIDNQTSSDALKELSFLTKMGCYYGYASMKNKSHLFLGGLSCVLDYDMERQVARELYAEGEPCSQCANDVGCDSTFTGLCATT